MPKLITWPQLVRALKSLGYEPQKPGQRGGSAVPFKHKETGEVRSFHRPHGGMQLKLHLYARRLKITKERLAELAG